MDSLSNTTFSWDSSFDEFLCACGEATDESLVKMCSSATSQPSHPQVEPTCITNVSNLTENTQSSQPSFANRARSSSIAPCLSTTLDQTVALSCMWGDCQARFTSLSDLVGHVNLEHLRLPSSPIASPTSIKPIPGPDLSRLSCLWRDCNIYPSSESIPTSSSGDQVDGILNILANHLLHDHLGSYRSYESLPAPTYKLDHYVEPTQPIVIPESTDGSLSPSSCQEECPEIHICCWQSCKESFSTLEDLTSHITIVHVGGGKAQYECFWEGCSRNGSNGFSSKQKICRHLQVTNKSL